MKVTVSVEGIDGDPSGESIRAVSAAEHSTVFASVLQELYPSLKSFESVDLSVAFVSSEYMRNLNLQYRELDEPTDVLSFPLWEVEGAFRPTWSGPDLPLGDVVICEDVVRESAEEQGIPFACSEGYCGTCIVEVVEGGENLTPPTQQEIDFLGEEGVKKERMACQCRLKGGCDKSVCVKLRF